MNKEAIAAKSLLKALAAGTTVAGLTGGAGYLGHQIGYKGGATKATNEMASAFSEANTQENQQIRDSFNMFNKRENAAIASNYMRRGMALGAQLHATGKIKTPEEMVAMSKTSSIEDIYNAAFEAELEKNAIVGTLAKSFKAFGKGLSHQGGHIKKQVTQSGKRKMSLKTRASHMGRSALSTAKKSKAALGTVAGGTALTGAALS